MAHIRQVASAARMLLKKAHYNVISSQSARTVTSSKEVYTLVTPQTARRLFTESSTPVHGRFAALSIPTRGRTPRIAQIKWMSSIIIPHKILSINVARSSTAHKIALNSAVELKIDILLIQDLYIFKDITRKISKNHPAFEFFPLSMIGPFDPES